MSTKKEGKAWCDSSFSLNLCENTIAIAFSHNFDSIIKIKKRKKDSVGKENFSLNFLWRTAKLIQLPKCTLTDEDRDWGYLSSEDKHGLSWSHRQWRILENINLWSSIYQMLRLSKWHWSRVNFPLKNVSTLCFVSSVVHQSSQPILRLENVPNIKTSLMFGDILSLANHFFYFHSNFRNSFFRFLIQAVIMNLSSFFGRSKP